MGFMWDWSWFIQLRMGYMGFMWIYPVKNGIIMWYSWDNKCVFHVCSHIISCNYTGKLVHLDIHGNYIAIWFHKDNHGIWMGE
jgi:hypothetical protein